MKRVKRAQLTVCFGNGAEGNTLLEAVRVAAANRDLSTGAFVLELVKQVLVPRAPEKKISERVAELVELRPIDTSSHRECVCPMCNRTVPAAETKDQYFARISDPKYRECRGCNGVPIHAQNLLRFATIADLLQALDEYQAGQLR